MRRKIEFDRNEDRQSAAPVCRCRLCGGEIYEGQTYYAMPQGDTCKACFFRYAYIYFSPNRRVARVQRL